MSLDGKSNLEATFAHWWRAFAPHTLPDPVTQYRFHETRKWLFDNAWPDRKLAVELDGAGGGGYGRRIHCHNCGCAVRATRKGGMAGAILRVPFPSHASGKQSVRDAEKRNAAVEAGWRVLVYTAVQLADEPDRVIEQVVRVLQGESNG